MANRHHQPPSHTAMSWAVSSEQVLQHWHAICLSVAVFTEGEHVITRSHGLTAKIWAVSSEQFAGVGKPLRVLGGGVRGGEYVITTAKASSRRTSLRRSELCAQGKSCRRCRPCRRCFQWRWLRMTGTSSPEPRPQREELGCELREKLAGHECEWLSGVRGRRARAKTTPQRSGL